MRFKIRNNLDVYDVLFWGIEFFCFFPFLFPLELLHTDIQPYALILGIIFLFLKVFNDRGKLHCRKEIMQFGILCGIAIFIGVFSLYNTSLISILRALTTYLSLFIIPKVIEFYSEKNISRESVYKIYILIWFCVGLIQVIFERQFLVNYVSGGRISTSGYRGCISLASEPSFFGVQCYYFLYISKSFKKNRILFYILNMVAGVFFAQSFVGILFIASFFLQEYFDIVQNYKKILYLIIGILVVVITINFIINENPDSRLASLLNVMDKEGIVGLSQDESGQVRIYSIQEAFDSVSQHFLLPQGFGGGRVGCAWGSLLVEIGFFGIWYMVILLKIFSRNYHRKAAQYDSCISYITLFFKCSVK